MRPWKMDRIEAFPISTSPLRIPSVSVGQITLSSSHMFASILILNSNLIG